MSIITPPEAARAAGLTRQKHAGASATRGKRTAKLAVLHIALALLIAAAAVWAYHFFQPVQFTHPDFDAAAVSGAPEVDERYGYSTLTVDEEYAVQLCGVPANDGQTVEWNLTNPADNGVWFRAEVLDEGGETLASTGVLRQGEYLPSVTLSRPLTERETPVTVRIVVYEPDTWQSRGNVNLNLTLYLNFS